jgi:hypothetical protein
LWVRRVHQLFLDLAEALVLLYDGAVATAQMDKAPQAARTARRTAELILDNASTRHGTAVKQFRTG